MRSKWGMVFLIWVMMVVAYMDRVNISLAATDLTRDLHFTKGQIGSILAAFSLGYAVMQVPGGWLSDRLGSKPLLVAGLLFWSLFTGLTGLCSALVSFLAVRVLFGAGEGLENGAQFKLIGDHFSERGRSQASGVFLSSLALGPAIATPISSRLIGMVGWRTMFWIFAGLGALVALAILWLLPNSKKSAPSRIDWKPTIARPQVWMLLLGYLMFNIAFWGFVGWTPSYLREQRHISLSDLGLMGSIPYLCGFVGLLLVGIWGSRGLYARRNLLVAGCFIGASVALYGGLSASSQTGCLAGLSIAAFFLYSAFAPFWSLGIDLATPETRGGLTGMINFGGQLGGFIGQYAIGIIAGKMHSFNGAILLMSATLLCGGLVLGLMPKPQGLTPSPATVVE